MLASPQERQYNAERCSNGVRFTAEIIPVNLIQIMLAEEFEAWRAFLRPHPLALTTRDVPSMSSPLPMAPQDPQECH